jgi:hypothetical protein
MVWRSSGLIEPSVFSRSEIEPFLPSAETRTASIACSSLAAAISASSVVSRTFRSLICSVTASPVCMLACLSSRGFVGLFQEKTRAGPASAGFPYQFSKAWEALA